MAAAMPLVVVSRPALSRERSNIGERLERIGRGEFGDGVETAQGGEPFHQQRGLTLELPSQRLEDWRGQDRADDLPCAGMGGWVGFQQQTRYTPRLLLAEITQAGPGCRRKGLPALKGGVHLFIACHPPDTIGV